MRPLECDCLTCGAGVGMQCEQMKRNRYHPARYKSAHMSPNTGMLRSARRASESPIPYDSPLVTFIWNVSGHTRGATHLRFAVTREEKVAVLTGPRRKLYCVWPGATRTDLFIIDEPQIALQALK
jgi:hypothetical protein